MSKIYEGKGVKFVKNSMMMIMTLALILGGALSAEAVLIDRGGGMIYSTEMNVTWLQDANYAQTSGYSSDGRMTWNAANAWAQNLSFGGFDDWRLPTFDPAHAGDYSRLHEMAFMNYVELENSRSYPPGFANTDPFINFPPMVTPNEWVEPWYWSGTLTGIDNGLAWRYDFSCG